MIYTLKELAPTGFETPAEITFTVSEGGTITQPTNTELLDNGCYKIGNKKPAEGQFRLLKVDENGNPQDGVEFKLYDLQGNEIETGVTNNGE